MANVLIIDDDRDVARMLAKMILKIDHQAEYELTLTGGVKKALSGDFDVIFLDVRMPDGNGLEALRQLRMLSDPPEVIIITGIGDPDGAELAIKNGAWDYLQKPLSPKKILLPVKRVLQYRDHLKASTQIPFVLNREGIIGTGPKIDACLKQLATAATSEANVLITGETGTGKELFAKKLHENSRRSGREMVVVDCGALPETLVESSLFGHVRGAFTGADQSKMGLIKMAHQTTLFLDEVCELGLPLQKAFLRVLQEKKFRPVGSQEEVFSDFRVIAATNRDPDDLVRQGLFRKDLLYRLRAINIQLPPLRERLEDIGELVLNFTERITKRNTCPNKGFSGDLIESLCRYSWPGNVRELWNALESAISAAKEAPILFPSYLPQQIRIEIARASVETDQSGLSEIAEPDFIPSHSVCHFDSTLPTYKSYREAVLSDAEKFYLEELLIQAGSRIKDACEIADIGRTRLYALLKKHKIIRNR